MNMLRKIFCLVVALITLGSAQKISVEFIGNAGVQLTDSVTSILLDCPYRSGASGYMTYDFSRLQPPGKVLSVITHRHADHFDAALFRQRTWHLLAPDDLRLDLPEGRRLTLDLEVRFGDISIFPLKTPHSTVAHYSYLLEWHRKRIYVTGDTESLDALVAVGDLDVLFITPWLLYKLERSGHKITAKQVFIYHHTATETVDCNACILLDQGKSYLLNDK